jgi:arginase family enzyme
LSRLRAKCPFCRTFTAVALGPDYECHSCGREFHAGLVRVPQAWGSDGEAMAEAAWLELPYPEAGIVEAESLEEQSLALAADLPGRPLVLGGCCCSHIGAVEGLAARQGRISLVWFDAHGDLNTPETSPSGNQWGMPLRMLLDSGAVRDEDTLLVGARELDPPEEQFLASSRVHRGAEAIPAALDGTGGTYVALDLDVAEPSELSVFMPEPGGLSLVELEGLLRDVAARRTVLGAGLTGLSFEPSNVAPLGRLTAALGL